MYLSSAREGGGSRPEGKKIIFGNPCCWYDSMMGLCGFLTDNSWCLAFDLTGESV